MGDSVLIEAKVSGDVKEVNCQIIGPDKTMEIPLADFYANGIYSGPWETSFSKPGNYKIEVDLVGRYGRRSRPLSPFA